MDAGENVIAGVTVVATYDDGSTIATVTNANGQYSFNNLPAGTYTISLVNAPIGLTFGNSSAYTVTLATGESFEDGDFCLKSTGASIGDFIFFDLNTNGVYDMGEAGAPGVEVTLTDANGNQTTVISNSSGQYSFTNLEAGTYTVTVGEGPTDFDLTTVGEYAVTVGANDDFTDADFGFGPFGSFVTTGIGGTVWQDDNGNGAIDAGETGIPNVTVTLLDANGNEFMYATTDANGNYIFSDIFEATYTVVVGEGPDAWTLTTVATQQVSPVVGIF